VHPLRHKKRSVLLVAVWPKAGMGGGIFLFFNDIPCSIRNSSHKNQIDTLNSTRKNSTKCYALQHNRLDTNTSFRKSLKAN